MVFLWNISHSTIYRNFNLKHETDRYSNLGVEPNCSKIQYHVETSKFFTSPYNASKCILKTSSIFPFVPIVLSILQQSHILKQTCSSPTGNYMFKVNNRNTTTRCETCSKLIIKTPKRCHWRHSGVFIVNLECIFHLVLTFLLLTLSW